MLRQIRSYSSTATRTAAAAATARKPVARAPVRRAAAAKPAATTPATPASTAPAPPTPAPAQAAPQSHEASFDDFDADFKFHLPDPEISDYAHLRRPLNSTASHSPSFSSTPFSPSPSPSTQTPTPTPSPPLSALPDSSYVPLPSASLGSSDMRDAYVFSNGSGKLPGEIAAADWTTSFKGLSERPFEREVAEALLKPLEPLDVEIKPDGLLYLPEIKYRRTLNAAFGPGGWGMAPRGETHVGPKIVSREWGLVCLGRLVAIARGEQEYFDPSGVPTATEACKSNALMRCCKDLGIASELWDPRFIREFKAKYCVEMMVEHVVQKKKRKLWRKKDAKFDYPYKEVGPVPK